MSLAMPRRRPTNAPHARAHLVADLVCKLCCLLKLDSRRCVVARVRQKLTQLEACDGVCERAPDSLGMIECAFQRNNRLA